MKNIVLIGGSGSGKTSVGKLLSEHFGMPFVDTDKLIDDRMNIRFSGLLQPEGEEKFRETESEIIRELSGTSGRIIATGGGVVLREENIYNLKKRSLIVFIDRPIADIIADLDTEQSSYVYDNMDELYKQYIQRLPLYNKYCDVLVSNDKSVEGCAREIIRRVTPLLQETMGEEAPAQPTDFSD